MSDVRELIRAAASEGPVPPDPGMAAMRALAGERVRRRRATRNATALAALALLVVSAEVATRLTDSTSPPPRVASSPGPAHRVAAPSGPVVEVRPGELVLGGEQGTTLTAAGTAAVRVDAGARLRVDVWDEDRAAIRVEDGKVEVAVEHRDPGQSFEVRTEFATVHVVGTRFSVLHRPAVTTEVRVDEGSVSVVPATGGLVRLFAPGVALFGPIEAPATSMIAGSQHPAPPDRAYAPVTLPAPAANPAAVPSTLSPEEAARALVVKGDEARAAGRLADARAAYEAALATWPGRPPEGLLVDLALVVEAMGDPEAWMAWQRYLNHWPRGRFAGRAHDAIARADEVAGRDESARDRVRRMLDDVPDSPETAPAFARAGRRLIDRGELDLAERWFSPRLGSHQPAIAEAALVGLMRVRLGQGREDDVRALAALHANRFPAGLRRAEVDRVVHAIDEATTP